MSVYDPKPTECRTCGVFNKCAQCNERGCECDMELVEETDEWVHPECLGDYKDELKVCPNCNGSGGGDEHWRCPDCRGTGERRPGPDDNDDGDRRYDEMVDRQLEGDHG